MAPDVSSPLAGLLQTEAAREPVRYTGELQPDPRFYDGRLPHAVGVHHIQVVRAPRPAAGSGIGFTYNHQPYLVWWGGRFHLQFLSAPRSEHEAPTLTFLCTSVDGYTWSEPRVAFPEYRLPAFELGGVFYPAGLSSVMHQRMGFYVAPNGRLLTVGFYGICPDTGHSPNAGNGVGRVVREIRADGTLGEIHFIRYNRHAGFDQHNTSYPFYTASPDAGFHSACESLLADKLATLQWWEEDRGTDGFFPLDPGAVPGAPRFDAEIVTSAGAGKAFTWYTRPDGVIVGLWKNQYGALSPDGGRSWTPIVSNRTLRTTGAKTWGQRTSDGRYAIVYNHSATGANRFPISALVGADGQTFPTLLCLGGEVAPRRYSGAHKGTGMHYFRGISEGGAQPPDGSLWIAYSMNKEDIWVLRAHVPLSDTAPLPTADEIAAATNVGDLSRWNFHLPKWGGAQVVSEPYSGQPVLELRDEDPWDQAQAERVFPTARRLCLRFRLQVRELPSDGRLEIDVQSQRHHRPIRLRIAGDGLRADGAAHVVPFPRGLWRTVAIECDCATGRYSVQLEDVPVFSNVPFAELTPGVERVVFRTGAWRGEVPAWLVDGSVARREEIPAGDLGGDTPVAATVCRLGQLTAEIG